MLIYVAGSASNENVMLLIGILELHKIDIFKNLNSNLENKIEIKIKMLYIS